MVVVAYVISERAGQESLPNRYSALQLAHVCACVTGIQRSALHRFGRFANDYVVDLCI